MISPNREEVKWAHLPRKGQLLLLCACRTFDFLQIASFQTYMYYQVKSFDSRLPDTDITVRAGILQGAFTAAQCAAAVPWGRIAEAPWGGRKPVLLIGLFGTAVSCLGLAFSTTFNQALLWRFFGGAINGTVGIIRTMIAETIEDRRYHSRAFLILPLAFNIATLFGPVIGGMLSDPVSNYPEIFGANSILRDSTITLWLIKHPYGLPMLLNFSFISLCAVLVTVYLKETLKGRQGKSAQILHILKDKLRGIGTLLPSHFSSWFKYASKDTEQVKALMESGSDEFEEEARQGAKQCHVLPFGSIFTRNVLRVLMAIAFFEFHMGAFGSVWPTFLSMPRDGGLGMSPRNVGFATAIMGIIGTILQFTIYPSVSSRLGVAGSFQYFLLIFPFAYAITASIFSTPHTSSPPQLASGLSTWLFIILILALHVMGRTFTIPTSIILLNNSSPHPSVLGIVHGIGQSVSSSFRSVGPVISSASYAYGLQNGIPGLAWWFLSLVSAIGWLASLSVCDGPGHQILLLGEEMETLRASN